MVLVSSGDINHGNIEIKEFMEYLSIIFILIYAAIVIPNIG